MAASSHNPLSSAASPVHLLAVPTTLAIFAAAIVLTLIVRVNAELAGLLTQMVRTMAAIGRLLIAALITVMVVAIVLAHL
jgi:hypothetical protein